MNDVVQTPWQSLPEIAVQTRLPNIPESDRYRHVAADPLYAVCYAGLLAAMAVKPLVIAQIGQSLDGRIATESGHSSCINGPESLDHLHRLRGLVDAVVVGATTLQLDNPRLTTRRVAGRNPVRVVIDPNGRLNPGLQALSDAASDTLVITTPGRQPAAAGRFETLALQAEDGVIPPAAILTALRQRGLSTILVEGGARTLSAFLLAGLIDRLHVMIAPLILGSGRMGLQLPSVARIDDGYRPFVRTYSLGVDVLFDCDLRQSCDALAAGQSEDVPMTNPHF